MTHYIPDPMPLEPGMPEAMAAVWRELEQIRNAVRGLDDAINVLRELKQWISAGSVSLSAPQASSIGAGYVQVPVDTQLFPPLGVTIDLAANAIRPDRGAAWLISANIQLLHNESNAGRQFRVQLWNATKAVGVGSFSFAVGRNQPGSNVSVNLLLATDETAIGDALQWRIGGSADSFSDVVFEAVAWSLAAQS